MKTDKRKMGRPRNPNLVPATARLATTKEALDKLDRMITYSRMPLGRKLETALAELEYYRKNLVGQLPQVSQPILQENSLSVNRLSDINECELPREEFNKLWNLYENEPKEIIIETDEGIIQE